MRCAECELAARHALGEHESATCTSPVAQTNCTTFLGLLRERAVFSLKLPKKMTDPLPHAASIKLQCGALAGLRQTLASEDLDAHRLVIGDQDRWGSLHDLPWPEIVGSVAAWQVRRRSPGS